MAQSTLDELAKLVPFWNVLNEEDREHLARFTTRAAYVAGEQIRENAAECLGGIIVVEGSVRVYIMGEDGREVTIARLRAHEPCLLGASCVMHSIAFDVFMEAEEATSLLLVAPQALNAVFERNMSAENWALNAVVDRFSDIMWTLQQILFMSFDKRLAIFLYEESARTGSDTVKMTQDRIAKHVGSAREVVSRMLSYFAEEGIVEVGRGRIEIRDRARLKKLALA